MAALLTSVGDDKDKMAIYLAECRSMGIKVLPPDVNTSVRDFAPVGTDIRFGLSAVRNVGTGVVASIVASRKDKGDYTDFYDFLEKVDQVACNKKVVESLIKAGAFDSLSHPRKGLLMEHARAIDEVLGLKKAEAIGQFDLFGEMSQEEKGDSFRGSVPDTEWDTKLRLGFEREMLGLYVSGHPLAGVEHILSAQSDASIPDILDGTVPDRGVVTVGGILTGLQRRLTKKGDPWASATLEDLAGGVEVAFFPKVYLDCALLLAEDAIVLVKGRVARSEDRLSLHAQRWWCPTCRSSADKGPVQVSIAAARCTPPVVDRLRDVLQAHPGTTAVHLKLLNAGKATTLKLDDGLRVTPTSALMGDLKALLRRGSVWHDPLRQASGAACWPCWRLRGGRVAAGRRLGVHRTGSPVQGVGRRPLRRAAHHLDLPLRGRRDLRAVRHGHRASCWRSAPGSSAPRAAGRCCWRWSAARCWARSSPGWSGSWLAPGVDPASVGATAADSIVIAPPTTGTILVVLAQPAMAAAVYTFLVAWNGHPDLGTGADQSADVERVPVVDDGAGVDESVGGRPERGERIRHPQFVQGEPVHRGRPPAGRPGGGGGTGRLEHAAAGQDALQVGRVDVVLQRGGVDPAQLGDGELGRGQREPDVGVGELRLQPAVGPLDDRRRGPARSAAGRRPDARRCPRAAADRRPAAPARGNRWPSPGIPAPGRGRRTPRSAPGARPARGPPSRRVAGTPRRRRPRR